MSAITAIGTYLPRLRLARSAMAQAMGWLAPAAGVGKGTRSLAFWDEDSITMGVAAARDCLAQNASDRVIDQLDFVTTSPVFREPLQASFIHAALRLDQSCRTQDLGGHSRAGLTALHQALESKTAALIVAADRPQTVAGSASESRLGDGAAAVLVGEGEPLFSYLGGVSLSAPFIERYESTDGGTPLEWEERWQREEGWMKLMPQAITAALQQAGLTASEIDCVVLPCTISGLPAALMKAAGLGKARLAANLDQACGDTGSGHGLMMLAHAMPTLAAGEKILLAQFGQGATVLVLQVEPAATRHVPSITAQLASGIPETNYMTLLTFRGQLEWDRGLRGRATVQEALSTTYRYHEALLGFVGGRCKQTGRVQFPPSRFSVTDSDGASQLDTLEPFPLADLGGVVATSTADRLAFTRHPPSCYGLVDLAGGGRLMMDFTDPDAEQLTSPDPVRFVFRIKDWDERTGYRRYFWKAVAANPPAAPAAV